MKFAIMGGNYINDEITIVLVNIINHICRKFEFSNMQQFVFAYLIALTTITILSIVETDAQTAMSIDSFNRNTAGQNAPHLAEASNIRTTFMAAIPTTPIQITITLANCHTVL
ncbi:unnamed protein product [Litomosoides sigmodontis]|uniref:Uncharacterized protein n=1 Tax=Litomosoides sigmodontis TaxID=42156 RepID=A0A3P6TJ62_LITSI|nr:unnamed protein product [Litomosoides sigmodontis]